MVDGATIYQLSVAYNMALNLKRDQRLWRRSSGSLGLNQSPTDKQRKQCTHIIKDCSAVVLLYSVFCLDRGLISYTGQLFAI